MENQPEKIKCLIVGSGPAGMTAAIYAARADLKPVVLEGLEPGGQLTTTTEVENFPGYPDGVTGPAMMEDLKKQAQRFSTDVRYGIVTKAELNKNGKHLITVDDKNLIETDTLIIATGATAKYLGLASEQRLRGSGVSACATCDGFFYRGKIVAVVGGGDTAVEEATYLSNLCKKVFLIVRKGELRASKAMQHKIEHTENIEVLYFHETKEVLGEQVVEGLLLINNQTNKELKIEIDGLFLAIGHTPNSEVFKGQLDMDETGYIITQPGSPKTSVPGVFAAGDVQDLHYRQAITAAGSGCMAAIEAERYISSKK